MLSDTNLALPGLCRVEELMGTREHSCKSHGGTGSLSVITGHSRGLLQFSAHSRCSVKYSRTNESILLTLTFLGFKPSLAGRICLIRWLSTWTCLSGSRWEGGGLIGYLIFRKGIQEPSLSIYRTEDLGLQRLSRFPFCPLRDSISGPQVRGRQTRGRIMALNGGQHSSLSFCFLFLWNNRT